MRADRPRSIRDDLDDDLPVLGGSITSHLFPDDLTLSTDEELAAWKREIAETLARKRPAGFAAWADEGDEPQRLRVVS